MTKKNLKTRILDEATTTVAIRDTISLPTSRVFDPRGAMVAPASIARTGIMDYLAKDLGESFKDEDPNKIIRVMTRDEDLFSEATMQSFRSAPITIGHPDDDVTTANAAELQYGFLEGMPTRLNDSLDATIVLSHKDALDLVQSKEAEELSAGTNVTIVRLSDAEALELGYDAYKTDIVCNHVAIVKRGRAGSARIADEAKLHDELTQEIATLTTLKDELEAKLDASKDKVSATEVLLKDALDEVEAMKLKVSDEAIKKIVDTKVEDALNFLQVAVRLTDKDISGLPILDAKKLILKDALGKDYSDKSEVFINNRFEALVEEGVNTSGLHQALRDHASDTSVTVEAEVPANVLARQQMIERNIKGNK